MYRYLQALFSHKLQILLPLLLVPTLSLAGGAYVTWRYDVSATLWVNSAPLLASLTDDPGRYQEPSETEASTFAEWLTVKTFIRDVMARNGLDKEAAEGVWPPPSRIEQGLASVPSVGPDLQRLLLRQSSDPEVRQLEAAELIRKSLSIAPVSRHVIKVTYTGDDPRLGSKLVSTTIDLLNEKATGSQTKEMKEAIDLLQTRADGYSKQLESSANALREYREAHPAPANPNAPRPPTEDEQITKLDQQYAFQRTLYEAAVQRLEQARLSGEANLQTNQSRLLVADRPDIPQTVTLGTRQLLVFGAIGILVGLILGLGNVLIQAWLDPTVRSAEDLKEMADIPVLAIVPRSSAYRYEPIGKAHGQAKSGWPGSWLLPLLARRS